MAGDINIKLQHTRSTEQYPTKASILPKQVPYQSKYPTEARTCMCELGGTHAGAHYSLSM